MRVCVLPNAQCRMPNVARQLVVCVIFIAASTVAHSTRWPAAKLPSSCYSSSSHSAGKSVKWKITIVYNISSRQAGKKSRSQPRFLASPWLQTWLPALSLCCLLISISVYSGYDCQYLIKWQIPSACASLLFLLAIFGCFYFCF